MHRGITPIWWHYNLMQGDYYKIGEAAAQLDTSIRTIRYYEEEGLLTSIRSQKGTRLYTEKHIRRLKVILRLTALGFSLESIRQIATLREKSSTGDESSALVDGCLNDALATIHRQMQELEQLKAGIERSKQVVEQCTGCLNKPSSKGCPQCPVRMQMPHIEFLNLVWDTE